MGGEFALIRRYFSALADGPQVALGPGDDAAVLRIDAGEELVVSTDTQLADVHFPSTGAASQISYRAVAAAVSDLAAMGARPLGMTLALTLPAADGAWLQGCSEGLAAAVTDFGLPLVGGDTTRGPLALTVTVLGACPAGAALRRSGARAGDRLCVSDNVGDAAAGLAIAQRRLEVPGEDGEFLLQGFWKPRPELALGAALRGVATAAIDVSDGLLADAGHLASASGVGLEIDSASLPLSPALRRAAGAEQALDWALAGGDDYVLCFTLPPECDPPPGCSAIGRVVDGSGVSCDVSAGAEGGYEHFT